MKTDGKVEIGSPLAALGIMLVVPVAAVAKSDSYVVWWLASIFCFLSVVAVLMQADRRNRVFILRTLRKKRYTQFYSFVSEGVKGTIWPRYCDDVDDDANPIATFWAALTWRLYDRALLIAVLYPIFLLVGFWIIAGGNQPSKLGSTIILETAGFWPQRAVTLGIIALVMISPIVEKWAAASPKIFLRKVSGWQNRPGDCRRGEGFCGYGERQHPGGEGAEKSGATRTS